MKSNNMKKFITLFIITLVALVGTYTVYREGTLPVDKNDTDTQTFEVKSGESMNSITNKLANEKLIRSKLVFYLVVKRLGIEKTIQAGKFILSPSMTAEEVAKSLTHGTEDSWVTIIEGLRKEEVAEIIAQKFQIPEMEFTNAAEEGYLFPETYRIPSGANTEKILSILKNTFDSKFDSKLRAEAKQRNLTEKQVIILASLVEREARTPEDKQQVANILLKRLQEEWHLNIDATVQYILGYQPGEKRWWKKELSTDDLEINSPYNTYKVIGLPPGPICSPGLESIQAVAQADNSTPYWYYISDLTGKMHYAKTLEEHNANIDKYL